ncbi:MAG: CooT family nickel-binding protein [Syntrophales bacterium]
MCQINAYVERGGIEELIMENVDIVEPEGKNISLRSIFGEQKVLPLRIKYISMVNNKITLEE